MPARKKADDYKVVGVTEMSREYSDFMYRRIGPLLDRAAMQSLPLEHIAAEAYRIGVLDAVDVMSENNS